MKSTIFIFFFFLLIISTACKKQKEEEELIEPPKASFTYSKDSLKITCTSTSTGDIVSLTWEFGDSKFNVEENNTTVEHTYNSASTYTITLTAANGAGHGVDVQSITVP